MRLASFYVVAFPLIAGLLLAGCARESATRNNRPAAPDTAVTAAENEAPPQPSGRPGVPLEALARGNERRGADGRIPVLRRLGAPLRVETETRENIHVPSQTDTVRTYTYDGMELTVYTGGGEGKQIITALRVTGPGYETADGLHVGSSAAAVRAARGAPSRTEDGALIYEQGEAAPDIVRFRVEEEQVQAIEWDFYFDG